MKAPRALPHSGDGDTNGLPSPRTESALNTQDLLAGARRGEDEAWEEIFRRYRAMLSVMVRIRIPGMLRSRFDTEDVLQAAFISVFEQIRRFEYQGEGSFRRWLSRVVVNKLRDNLKHHQRSKRAVANETPLEDTRPLDAHEDPASRDPSTAVDVAEQKARTLEAMTQLSEEDQNILCMRIMEKMSFPEIAGIEGLSENTARRRYESAVVRLTRISS